MERKENNGFGPIFVDRRKRPVVIVGMILLTVTLVYRLDREAITFYSFIISSVIFGQLLRRIFLFAEEISHLETRHDGSYKKAIVHCLGIYTLSKCTIFFGSVLFTATSYFVYMESTYTSHYCFTCSVVAAVLPYALGINFHGKLEVYNDMRLKFVADGQAWGYYFGYLKIIFERWEANIQLLGADINFRQSGTGKLYRDLLTDTRLFIIIPKDGDCYNKIEELDSRIKFETKMPEMKSLRGGVQERSYVNSLYRIDRSAEEKEPVYVMMEFATPLLNMYDMAKEAEIPFTLEDREEQVTEFYTTLRKILDKKEGSYSKCVLVLTGPGESLKYAKRKLADIICDLVESTEVECN